MLLSRRGATPVAEQAVWPVQPAKVQMVSAFDNFFGSVVGIQNALLAPLAPFGRKLQQGTPFIDTVGNTQTNPVSRSAPSAAWQTAPQALAPR